MDDIPRQLNEREEAVSSPEGRRGVQRTWWKLERVPGNDHIRKY